MQKVEGKYVIVCSRGPGSETIITETYAAVRKDDGKLYHDAELARQDMLEDVFVPNEEIEPHLKHLDETPLQIDDTFSGIEVMWEDEGPVLFSNESTTDEDIRNCLVQCFSFNEQELDFDCFKEPGNEELQKLIEQMNKAKLETADSFISAIFRSWIDVGQWTSVDSWRNLESEVMSKELVDEYIRFTGQSIDAMAASKCKVLNECAYRYPDHLPV